MADNASIQKRLNELGAEPPLVVDGALGPATQAVVMRFQKTRGLVADGKVGLQTLAALGLSSAVSTVPAPVDPNNIHARAKIATDKLGLTPAEGQFVRMVAWHETNYGQGWKAGEGAGSFNMGAITTTKPGPLDFQHKDSRNDTGQVITYTTWFKGYPSFEAGMQGLAMFLLKPNVKAALAKNDFRGAVQAMYDNHYFLGIHARNTPVKPGTLEERAAAGDGNAANVLDYVRATQRAFTTFSRFTGETMAKAGLGLGLLAVLGAVGYAVFRWKFA